MPSSPPSTPSPFDCPSAFLSSRQFHQRIASCPRTKLPITYSVVGDLDGPPSLLCGPSGNSRLLPIIWHPLAQEMGIRIITIDRPGTGGTARGGTDVELDPKERIRVSCLMMESVLERENVELGSCGLISISAGIYYALHLLLHHSHLFSPTNPRLYALSPWYPPFFNSTKAFHPLLLVPTLLVKAFPPLVRWGVPSLDFSTAMLDKFSPGLKKKSEAGDGKILEDYFPPEFFPLLWKAKLEEGMPEAMVEEFLLCLGRRGVDSGADWYSRTISALVDRLQQAHSTLAVEIWWGEKDDLVREGARDQLDKLLFSHPSQIAFTRHSLPNRDHDDLIEHEEGVLHLFMNIVRDVKAEDESWRRWYDERGKGEVDWRTRTGLPEVD